MPKDLIRSLLPNGLTYSRHTFRLTFTTPGVLGAEGAASALRDGIGCMLKRVCECEDAPECPCPYCQVFKPKATGSASPGFVLHTGRLARSIRVGQTTMLRLTLMGRAQQALIWFVTAIVQCGLEGIGSPRSRFAVELTDGPEETTLEDILVRAEQLQDLSEAAVRFVSPCMLVDGGRHRVETDFPRLMKAVVERLQPNVGFWCGSVLRNQDRDGMAADLIGLAGRVESRFTPGRQVHEQSRGFSGKRDSLFGFTGTLTLCGNLRPFLPLLMAGEALHVGQRPHLDRGRYVLQLGPREPQAPET